MELSFYSLLTSVVWSGLLLGIIVLCRKWIRGFWRYDTAALYLLLLGCVFRCFFPLEFSGFTRPFSLYNGLYRQTFNFLNRPISVPAAEGGSSFRILPMTIAAAVWGVIAVILLVRLLVRYRSMVRSWELYEEVTSGTAYEMAAAFCDRLKIKRVRILQDGLIAVPQVCGLLYPRVLLPDQPYTETELRYILCHELTHWKNGDILMRFLVCLLRALFWWNPFLYLLPRYLEETQELRCDADVVAAECGTGEERVEYLDALLRTLQDTRGMLRSHSMALDMQAGLVEEAPSKESTLKKRADVIANYVSQPKRERRLAALVLCFLLVLTFFSYRYVLMPGSTPPKEDLRNERTPDMAYLVQDGDFYWICSVDGDIPPQRTSQKFGEMMLESGFPLKDSIE